MGPQTPAISPGACGRSLLREKLVHVLERLELERVAERIQEEHGRLLARQPAEANVRLDDEAGADCRKLVGKPLPIILGEDHAEVAHRDLVAVNEAYRVAHGLALDLV